MKTQPVVAADMAFDDCGTPYSTEYADSYHPLAGAWQQARHVFIAGNGLPQRWAGRARFVILETGFGLGNNFLATWQAWRDDPSRCERLVFISIEERPLTRADLAAVFRPEALQPLAAEFVAAWPPLTPNLHTLRFENGSVQLLLALGDIDAWLPEIVASVDGFYLDGFAPARNPRMWDLRVCKALGRMAAADATLATWTAARSVRDALTTAGFEVRAAPGTGGKRDITLARHAPRFMARSASRPGAAKVAPASAAPRRALIVGGGLAGCGLAWALAEHGWSSRVIDRHAQPAAEASGNAAGLFHGIVHAQDGTHARFNRAAALMVRGAIGTALAAHGVNGATQGLLRLETHLDPVRMQALLAREGLPPEYVQALGSSAASELAGLPLQAPAWYFPGGGWVDPAALARSYLERAGARVTWCGGRDVHALRRVAGGWELLGRDGAPIDTAPTVVLANGFDVQRLLDLPDTAISSVRGQISRIRTSAAMRGPRLPVAGAGYVIPAPEGWLTFGATSQPGDADPEVRAEDHAANLAQLARLIGSLPDSAGREWQGRTAWRATSEDRLPLIGAVPDRQAIGVGRQGGKGGASSATPLRLDQPRFVPRLPGLYAYAALGSRGITMSALGGQLLAALIAGAPLPVEAGLVDAVDPARFVSRRHNRDD
jgi:tRNA 5-methylaminomethyl-2-thiouridine biosynthesis bifunctional protein